MWRCYILSCVNCNIDYKAGICIWAELYFIRKWNSSHAFITISKIDGNELIYYPLLVNNREKLSLAFTIMELFDVLYLIGSYMDSTPVKLEKRVQPKRLMDGLQTPPRKQLVLMSSQNFTDFRFVMFSFITNIFCLSV